MPRCKINTSTALEASFYFQILKFLKLYQHIGCYKWNCWKILAFIEAVQAISTGLSIHVSTDVCSPTSRCNEPLPILSIYHSYLIWTLFPLLQFSSLCLKWSNDNYILFLSLFWKTHCNLLTVHLTANQYVLHSLI